MVRLLTGSRAPRCGELVDGPRWMMGWCVILVVVEAIIVVVVGGGVWRGGWWRAVTSSLQVVLAPAS